MLSAINVPPQLSPLRALKRHVKTLSSSMFPAPGGSTDIKRGLSRRSIANGRSIPTICG
jgi:hypothetical protein